MKYIWILLSVPFLLPLDGVKADPYRRSFVSNNSLYDSTSFFTNAITHDDPSVFLNLKYIGIDSREMYDRRVYNLRNIKAYLFEAKFKNRKSIEIQVDHEFGSVENALYWAKRVAFPMGQIPRVLSKDVQYISIQSMNAPFTASPRARRIRVYTGQFLERAEHGSIEEALVHEGVHVSLDYLSVNQVNQGRTSPGWKKAQKNDGMFISAYAENSPKTEDMAESFLPWLLLRCLPDRISSNDKTKIQKAIPNRLEYFDSLNFSKADLYPISSIKGCRKPNQINIKVAQSLNTGSKIFNDLWFMIKGTSSEVFYHTRGRNKILDGDYHGGISDLNKVVEQYPNYPKISFLYTTRGYAKAMLGDGQGSISDSTQAIIRNPKDVNSHRNRGIQKFKLQDYTGTISDMNEVIKLDPNNKTAYMYLGDAKYKSGDIEGACSDWQKASQLGHKLTTKWLSEKGKSICASN